MTESVPASLLSTYYPTSSSSLEQHLSIRVVWLPLSTCFMRNGEQLLPSAALFRASPDTVRGSAKERGSLGVIKNSFRKSSILETHQLPDFFENSTLSGLELALRQHTIRHGPLHVKEYRNSVKGLPPEVLGESAALHFHLTNDVGASRWENMDSHRSIAAVVVVIAASALSTTIEHAVQVVRAIFVEQFTDRVCRCLVVDSPPKLAAQLRNDTMFLCISSSTPLEEVAHDLLCSLGRAVGNDMATMIRSYSDGADIDSSILRTPLDKPQLLQPGRNSVNALIASRLKKKIGDLYLQLGAYDAAITAYGETQFGSNTDWLWCSATLESIAAVRFHQLRRTLFLRQHVLQHAVVQLQSDNPDWGLTLEEHVNELESVCSACALGVQKTLGQLKGISVPASMRQRLSREVDEVMSSQLGTLKQLLNRVRVCLAAGTWEVESDPRAYHLGGEVKRCVEILMKLACSEIDIYLKETLRQLGKAQKAYANVSLSSSATLPYQNAAILRTRELEAKLKGLELLAVRQSRCAFMEELGNLRLSISTVYGEEWVVRCLVYFAWLSCICGCTRRTLALLVELATIQVNMQEIDGAVHTLLRVCFLSGAQNTIPLLYETAYDDPFVLMAKQLDANTASLAQKASCDCVQPGSTTTTGAPDISTSLYNTREDVVRDRGSVKESSVVDGAALLHVPLLLEVVEILKALGSTAALLRCQLATFLLFKHPQLLDRQTQLMLMTIVEETSALLEPHASPVTVAPPFFRRWEAQPLPSHLAPKTIPVGGAMFTFIDTQRLKLTVLCLDGRKLNSRTVWTVGDVASVLVTLYNPFQERLMFDSVALCCRSISGGDEGDSGDAETSCDGIKLEGTSPPPADGAAEKLTISFEAAAPSPQKNALRSSLGQSQRQGAPVVKSAPISYVLTNVELGPLSKRQVLLQVQPTATGAIVIDGVAMRLEQMRTPKPIVGSLPTPMTIPVLQRLPLVSCTLSASEVEIFGSQQIDFTVRVVNCGQVPIECISLTAHSEQCMLEGCEGCKERRNETDTTVRLNKTALDAASRAPLQPGDAVMIPGTLSAPQTISSFGAHYILFRVDCSLPHKKPTKPPNVPDAVPVFAVIPRRVMETRLRLFQSPGLVVTSVGLTKDRRSVEMRIANRSKLYSMELHLHTLDFADLPDAFIVAGAEYVVPPIKLTRILASGDRENLCFFVPWVVREIPHCTGDVLLDFSLIANEVVSGEPLDECVLSLDVEVDGNPSFRGQNSFSSCGVGEDSHDATPTLMYHWKSVPTVTPLPVIDASHGASLATCVVHQRIPSSLSSHPQQTALAATEDDTDIVSDTHGTSSGTPVPFASRAVSSYLPPRGEESDGIAVRLSTGCKGSTAAGADGQTTATPCATYPPQVVPIVLPAVTPIRLRLRATAPRWRRVIPLHVSVSIDSHFDVAVLTGAVESLAEVGGHGASVYDELFDLLAFKTGDHILRITIADEAGREITHSVHLAVEHSIG